MDNVAVVQAIASAMAIVNEKRAHSVFGPSEIWAKLGRIYGYLDKESIPVIHELSSEVSA
jgi:hypothetical protein